MKTPIWLAVVCLAASLPTQAQIFKPIELNDQELASLRGRYVMPGRIVSFGIVMTSTWQNANGEVIGATSSMQIQQSTIKPQFYVSMINEKGNGSASSQGTGTVTGGSGLNSTEGVTQVVRAAGDHNSAYNNVDINVTKANQAPETQQQGQALAAGSTLVRRQWRGLAEHFLDRYGCATQHRGQQQPGQHRATPRPGWADAEHDVARRWQPGPQPHVPQCRAA